MADPFVVVGAGAIGGTLGAHLIRAGHPVLLVDANRDHVAAVNENGLTIEGNYSAFRVPARAVTPDALEGPLHRVLIAVKTRHSRDAVELASPLLADDGFIVAMQNGLGALDIAERVGPSRTVAAAFTFGGFYKEPGVIVFSSPASFCIGNLDGSCDARLDELQRAFSALQPVEISDNIMGFVWAKLVLGAIYFASALVDADVCDQLDRAEVRSLFAAVAGEVADAAEAEGVRPESFDGFHAAAFAAGGRDKAGIEASWQGQRDYWHGHAQQRTGIWRDLAVHKRKTEAEGQLAPIIACAREHGLATPLLDRLLELIADVEEDRAQQGWPLLDRLREAAGIGRP
jgi:2-dehydropantoate 2-reductase